jgi:CRISPR type IV-associated protein Csf3
MEPAMQPEQPEQSEHSARMQPLRVTARLASDIANPMRPPVLDALLAYAVCLSEGRDPPDPTQPVPRVEIPLARSACGRVHLCSFAVSEVEQMVRGRFTNRRFPLAEAQSMAGPKLTRIQLTGGPCKSFRIPIETAWLAGDEIVWYCVGSADAVRDLLVWITHLGKRRGVGLGRVERWTVEAFDPAADGWGEGFPVTRDGRALRNLPLDFEGTSKAEQGYAVVTYPYWERDREELCLVPS